MDPESSAGEWLTKAQEDCEVARELLDLDRWDHASFLSQQAAEKALKAVQIHRTLFFERTHDLIRLARLLKAGPLIEAHAAILTQFYTGPRYPDEAVPVEEREAKDAVTRAEEVLRWAQTQLS